MAVAVLNSFSDAENLIREHEIESTTKFVTQRVSNKKHFEIRTEDITSLDGHKLQWKDTQNNEGPEIIFNGIPYINIGWMVKECQNGPDRQKKKKTRNKEHKDQLKEDHGYLSTTRKLIQDTKKLDCPASIRIRVIVKFPKYKVDNYDEKWKRKQASKQLKEDLVIDNIQVQKEIQYLVSLPHKNEHQNHLIEELAGFCQTVDNNIISKIHQLVSEEGIRNVTDLKRHISIYVKTELCPGKAISQYNRRFYPDDKTLKNHLDRALASKRYSKIDQENLEKFVEDWKKKNPDDKFFLRTSYRDENNNTEFLFVYQNSWQERLLNLYGNDIAIMDATYKTSNYSLPLYFICVQTNVGYSIVGAFITSSENQSSVEEALKILSTWNKDWKPTYFMTDFDEREINAIENIFEGCLVYLCAFHREQAWTRWTRDSKNGVGGNQEDILKLIRKLAHAQNEKDFDEAIEHLKAHEHWNDNKRLRNWFEKQWLSAKKRWVKAFREETYNIRITTTNGLERKHRDLKKKYLVKFSEGSISSLISTLVNEFFPDSYKNYLNYNVQSLDLCKKYNTMIPAFLTNRPKMLVEHCIQRIPPTVSNIPSSNITRISDTILSVQSVDSDNKYHITMIDEPKCSCQDWVRLHLPCKHILAVFQTMEGCSWSDMPEKYRNSPHFNLDPMVLEQVSTTNKPTPTPPSTCDLPNIELDDSVTKQEVLEVEQAIANEMDNTDTMLPEKKRAESLQLLKDIRNNIYLMNGDSMADLYEQLLKIKEYTSKNIQREGGIPKETQKINKPNIQKKPSKPYSALPPRKKYKKLQKKKSTFNLKETDSSILIDGTFDVPIVIEENEITTPSAPVIPEQETSSDLQISELSDNEKVIKTIWKYGHTKDNGYLMAKIGPFNITDKSLHYLKTTLPDEIIDAYLRLLTATRQDKNILHLPSATTTAIFTGNNELHGYLKEENLSDYDILIGPVNESQVHWTLIVVYPKEKKLLYVDPMGESNTKVRNVERKWRNFLTGRMQAGMSDLCGFWRIETVSHQKQMDSVSCGIFVIKFAESAISGEPLQFEAHYNNLQDIRYGIARQLLEATDRLGNVCRICLNTTNLQSDGTWVNCDTCEMWFHTSCTGIRLDNRDDWQKCDFQCDICKTMKKTKSYQVTFTETCIKEIPARKMRKPRLKRINNETQSGITDTETENWLFKAVEAKTSISQRLVSVLCGIMPGDTWDINKGEAIISDNNLATLYATIIEPTLKQVIEITEGSIEYHSPHWRHIRWINGVSLGHHLEMRNNKDGEICRSLLFPEDTWKELHALVMESFAICKKKTIIRIGYGGHGTYLSLKSTKNDKLLQTLENEMGQNLNIGNNYFINVLFVEAELLIASSLKNITLQQADELLYPHPYDKYKT